MIPNRMPQVAVGLCALLAAGVLTYRTVRVSPGAPNVLLILVDTLRADRLGRYGHVRRTAPFLEEYGGRSLVFDRAYSASSWTVPSVMSLFVGQRPFEHGVLDFFAPLPAEQVTLAEVLSAHGYDTAAFLATTALPAELGYGQGFAEYRVVGTSHIGADEPIDASAVNTATLEWLDRRTSRRPFFLYLHYMEPHWPYVTHEGCTPPRANVSVPDETIGLRAAGGNAMADAAARERAWDFSAGEVVRLNDLYDGEVRYLDRRVADLFAELDRRGALANTVVALTADHGEELGEHGIFGHGASLYEVEIRVPLLVHLPGDGHVGHVSSPVEAAGLAPTLLRAVGIEPPPTFRLPPLPLAAGTATVGLDGQSPVSQLAKIAHFGLWLHRAAVLEGDRKLLVAADGTMSARDLRADAAELRPLEPTPDEVARAAALDHVPARAVRSPVLDPAAVARLRALGYVDPRTP